MNRPIATIDPVLPTPLRRIDAYLQHHADEHGDAEAVVAGATRLSYASLAEQVAQRAAQLRALGVEPGDRVGVLASTGIDFWLTALATWSLDAIYLGLSAKQTRPELLKILTDARPKLLLAQTYIHGRDFRGDLVALSHPVEGYEPPLVFLFDVDSSGSEFRTLDSVTREDDVEFVARPRKDGDPAALLVYTSGTTGNPKGALISHGALIRGALRRAAAWPVDPFRTINNLPINHIGCVGDIGCLTLILGGCQIFLDKFSAERTLELIARERVSFWYQVPTMFQLCLQEPLAGKMDWSALQAAVWSGGLAAPALIQRLLEIAKSVALDYSMTESVGAISLTPLTRDMAVVSPGVGWPDSGRGIRLAEADRELRPISGESGEVQLRDAYGFLGYLGRDRSDGLTADGWFQTGDIAQQLPDGRFQLVGRATEMFKSGGYNIYPREVELAIERLPGVQTAIVVGVPDTLYGEVGVAFVTADDLSIVAIREHCRRELANYKIPKTIELIHQLPMLPIGKIDRQALRARALARLPA